MHLEDQIVYGDRSYSSATKRQVVVLEKMLQLTPVFHNLQVVMKVMNILGKPVQQIKKSL